MNHKTYQIKRFLQNALKVRHCITARDTDNAILDTLRISKKYGQTERLKQRLGSLRRKRERLIVRDAKVYSLLGIFDRLTTNGSIYQHMTGTELMNHYTDKYFDLKSKLEIAKNPVRKYLLRSAIACQVARTQALDKELNTFHINTKFQTHEQQI